LQTGGALAIDGHERNVGRNAPEHLSQTRADSASTALKHVPDNNISDHVSLGTGTLYGFGQYSGEQLFGWRLSEATFLGLGQCGANLLFAQHKLKILYLAQICLKSYILFCLGQVSDENKDVPQRR
jgi:hypothetical protein